MKRKRLFIVLFVVGFAAVYMIMSFAIPGFRIKLEAEPARGLCGNAENPLAL